MMKKMLFNTLSLMGAAMQSFFSAVKERFANKIGLSVHKIVFGISVLALVFFTADSGFAQCAAAGSVTTTITTTPNTCAGNGTIKATFSSATNITIQLIKGGSVQQAVNNPASPYTFTNLQPGTDYEVKTICSTNNSIVYSDNPNITVAENYVAISDADITVSNLCANFTQGGTITVNGITGGTAPYQYSIILNNNAGYDDILSSYSTPASTPPYTKNVTAFGTYQIRIKDACGNYKTFTKTLTPTLEAIKFYWRPRKICAPNNPKKAQIYAWYAVGATTGINVSVNDYLSPGIKMEIRDTNASGAILYSGIYTADGITYTESPTHQYYITTTNGCGLTTSYTHDLSNADLNPEFNNFLATSGNAGCGAAETMSISAGFVEQFYWKFPVSVIIKNSANVQVGTPVTVDFNGIANFANLPLGTYTVTATDQCGETLTKTVNSPVSSGTPALSIYQLTNWRCDPLQPLISTGTIQAVIQFSGYIPDRANAVVKIVSGPSNVGVNATLIDGQYYGWTNMAPGTYSVSVKSCGVEKFYPLTILASEPGILKQSLSSTAESFCSGGGNINSTKVFNGAYVNTVELLNLTGMVVASHVQGNFTNIPAGTYSTRIKVIACNSTYYIPGSTVTLTNSTTGPKITSSSGVICESGTGTPLTTGSAYLNLAGVAPFSVQYRVQGSAGAFTTINTSSSSLQIDNLIANTTYEVNLKDACGGNFPTTVQIKTVGVLTTNNSAQPCIGSPYTLSMPEYAGATYQWLNEAGTVLSNTRFYEFASYLAANDGVYTCKITWSNCVTRQATVTLNSALCGQPIGNCGLIDSDGDGVFDFCDLDDDNDGILDATECGPVEKVINGFNGPGVSFTGWTRTTTSTPGWIASSGIAIESSNDNPGIHTIKQTVNGLLPSKTYALTFDAFALGLLNPNPNTLSVTINGVSYYNKTAGVDINFAVQGESIGFTPTGTSVTIEFISTVTGTSGNSGRDVFVRKISILNCEKDTDADGIPDYLDLDSDNDGCPDALEGDENVTAAMLVSAGGTVTVGTGSSASKQNLGNTINANGVPNVVNTGGAADGGNSNVGQGLGNSTNANLKDGSCYTLVLNPDNYTGSTGTAFTTASILVNDLLDAVVPVIGTTAGQVVISQSGTWTPGITLNTTTGAVNVANTVPNGVYVVNYQACVNGTNPSLCQTQTITITLCGKLPTLGTPDSYTKTGISNLAGFANGWPGNVPNGFIAIESKNKGFVITRVKNVTDIPTADLVEGMLVYDISAACVKLYNGTVWKCLAKDCN
ncbi:MAG: hypothetical protein EOO42_04785 [Flavobacteriales bacterium]|nr:MAG: hypothetical protein EOO42_04785 [Flavobacteriales bacterium]